MYTPESFARTELSELHSFVEKHAFATLISAGSDVSDEPLATHLPLLLDRAASGQGMLTGHFARANPHWKSAANRSVLAIFHGAHAYISPSWYEATNVVPTWNYITVHAHGRLRLIDDRGQLKEAVRRLVAAYESPRSDPWTLDRAEPQFIDRLLDGIVGFTIDVQRWEGKWKLSQNHDVQRQDRVIAALLNEPSSGARQIALEMQANRKQQGAS
ncbi:MAG: FMN-binding negative transcriptional regulator [Planctomycetales bacterium]|nr:FMN-binding negative transcriptional regulator [Planctomycetales bacterium]